MGELHVAAPVFDSLTAIAVLACFRSAPFVAFLAVVRRTSAIVRLTGVVAFATLCAFVLRASPSNRDALLALPAVYAYLTALALLLPTVARLLREQWFTRWVLAVLLFVPYVLAPGLFAPSGALLPALLLGWDSWFKAFSYCVDVPEELASRRRNTLFFMLVSPTLVWAERGVDVGPGKSWPRGAVRCALALGTFMLEDVTRWASVFLAAQGWPGPLSGILRGVAYYLGHSGLASLQIGLMALLGYGVPERYVYPLLAPNPLDFWRRWNTWIGSWARRYVFTPLSVGLRRRFRRSPALLPQGVAALATFGAIGALHDALRSLQHARHTGARAISMDATVMFLGFALIVIGWASVKRLLSLAPTSRWVSSSTGRVLSWLAFAPWLAVMYWLAEWVLAGRGFPGVFRDSSAR